MSVPLTLYTAKICPYAHRVELALAETGIDFQRFEIDLQNKPEWYAPKVNPASKVPAIAYGGPLTTPENPSPESEKIAESLVLVELVADLANNSPLLPKDPILRARARFFIDAVSTKFVPAIHGFTLRGEPIENLYNALDALQALLPAPGAGKYAIGTEFTIADAAVAPFFARLEVSLKNDLGLNEPGVAAQAYRTLQDDARFARFRTYYADLRARESFRRTYDEAYVTEKYIERYTSLRAQKIAEKV